jgi:hypothetical protein
MNLWRKKIKQSQHLFYIWNGQVDWVAREHVQVRSKKINELSLN